MKKELFIAMDLELNQPSNKIIQIGAVVGNIVTGEILDTFSIFVNPNEKLGFCNGGENDGMTITDLTGITQEDVDNALPLKEAFAEFAMFVRTYDCFINPITWGGGDTEELRRQLDMGHEGWIFGRRWIDAKTVYITYRLANGSDPVGGLGKALTRVGLKFEGRKHDALDDAKNTFLIYKRLIDLFKKEGI